MVTVTHPDGNGYLGDRGASTVALDPNNPVLPGGWTAAFNPADLYPDAFEVWHIAVKGPAGGFEVWLDNKFYSGHDRSDRNEYDPKNAMYVRGGQAIFFYFNSAADPAPTVNIFARQPRSGVLG